MNSHRLPDSQQFPSTSRLIFLYAFILVDMSALPYRILDRGGEGQATQCHRPLDWSDRIDVATAKIRVRSNIPLCLRFSEGIWESKGTLISTTCQGVLLALGEVLAVLST